MPAHGEHPLPCRRREQRSGLRPKLFASLGDVFVNDAFSAAHRAHASTEGIAHLLPAYAGRAMEARARRRSTAALEQAEAPAGRGGRRRQGVDQARTPRQSAPASPTRIVIGGGMANTFLAAQGYPVGRSLCEHDLLADRASEIIAQAQSAARTASCCCRPMPWSPRNSRPDVASAALVEHRRCRAPMT